LSTVRVTNLTRDRALADRARTATNFFTRGIGLIGRRGLAPGEGLVIQPCNGVVSFFMRFTIDVLFLDGSGKVLKTLPHMVPWRASSIVGGSKVVVELPEGTIERTGTEVGDSIGISET
jgi:uncharacterized membrane protein (UPF0127 family)